MREFDSDVFNDSIKLSKRIRKLVKNDMDKNDQFTIGTQIIRASISISSNIAEGFGRNSDSQILNFLNIANGSCCEVISQLYVINDDDCLDTEKIKLLMSEAFGIKEQLRRLIHHYNSKKQ